MDNNIALAAKAIAEADTILITAGAGMGVDSGLPDFRGNQGFWNIHPHYAVEGLTFRDLADPLWFETHPERAWGFYGYRYQLYRHTVPHRGFSMLKRWQDSKPIPGFVYTSNVDGQFQKAGFAEDQIYECHGSIHHLQCCAACNQRIWAANNLQLNIAPNMLLASGALPTCPDCGEVARPNILMFGDPDWLADRTNEQRQRYQQWKQWVTDLKVVVIEIGAGSSVGGIRYTGQKLPGSLIRINPREPQGPVGTISLALSALAALTEIDAVLSKA
jgi:NAD-dependent SIR2 family protein deacetylase